MHCRKPQCGGSDSRHGGTNGARLSRRVSKGAAAVSGAAPGSSIGGFPTIWAQNIADQRVNLDLRLLRQFLVVCDSPSLTAAAAKLGLSTPAISQLIMRLERDLDISLLERSNHGTRLTPAGAAMRDHARSMLVPAGTGSARRALNLAAGVSNFKV